MVKNFSDFLKESSISQSPGDTLEKIANASDWFSEEWLDKNDTKFVEELIEKGLIKEKTAGHMTFYRITKKGIITL